MATYLLFGKYSSEALKGISAQRSEEAKALFKKHGGELKQAYATLGGVDLVMIADLDHLWIVANIDEARAGLLRIGQPAEVRVEAAGLTLAGTVEEITPATQSALAATQAQSAANRANTTSSTTARAPQTVPVRIALNGPPGDGASAGALYPGMTAEVKIGVR